MSITDAVTRISQIEAQIAAMNGGPSPTATAPASTTTAPVAASPATAPASFAAALSQAQSSAAPAVSIPGLSSGQQKFASRLASDTGLDPHVIGAWLLAEESGSAAQSRESAGNNDWLNIGYTDSGTFGSSDSVWSDPVTAADATAGWMKGQNTIPGYGTASSGIQAILNTAGQSPQAQISALQNSGWASSGYPDLPSLFSQVGG